MRAVTACGFCVITKQLHIYADVLPRLALKLWLFPSKLEKKKPLKLWTFEVSIDTRHATEGTTQPLKPCVLGSHVHTEFRKLLFAEGAIRNSAWLWSGSQKFKHKGFSNVYFLSAEPPPPQLRFQTEI